jgi:NAD(P)-dependent dehydrogenase (short-subunit alcohol dehydrogenase family)
MLYIPECLSLKSPPSRSQCTLSLPLNPRQDHRNHRRRRAIGKAIVLSFSHANASTIILLGRTLLTPQFAKSDVEPKCPNTAIHIHTCDVTSKRSVDKPFTAIHASHGLIHILINSADLNAAAHPVASVSAAEWCGVHQPNVLCTLLVSQAFLRNACAVRADRHLRGADL